jgi:fumarylacetoacetase
LPPPVDETHDPARTSWVASANTHADFPIQNLPLGVFSFDGGPPRGGVAIGDLILDLSLAAQSSLLAADALEAARAASGVTLSPLLGEPAHVRRALRRRLSELLAEGAAQRPVVETWLRPASDCVLRLPATIGDYTDFYAGIHHAENVGRLFRPDNPLLPNYKHVPIAYHGRASSVRASPAPVRRPSGQTVAPGAATPTFGPAQRLDFELELGVWVGEGNDAGMPIPIGAADAHIAGLCLLNDWSARDLQTWEYQPLGPFLAKSFTTSVSPWIVTAEALAPFRLAQPRRPPGDPQPLPYLWDASDQAAGAYALELTVSISSQEMRQRGLAAQVISRTAASHLYWTLAQMVAHHTSNGCDLRSGDLLGTGTISAPEPSGLGSLLEMTHGGREPVVLPTGETRTFLQDGDEVTLTGQAHAEGRRSIGFGPCAGIVTPARGA